MMQKKKGFSTVLLRHYRTHPYLCFASLPFNSPVLYTRTSIHSSSYGKLFLSLCMPAFLPSSPGVTRSVHSSQFARRLSSIHCSRRPPPRLSVFTLISRCVFAPRPPGHSFRTNSMVIQRVDEARLGRIVRSETSG